MCSVNEEDLDTLPEVEVGSEPLPELCKKCSGKGVVVLRKKDVYCVTCFVTSVNHKFRASLGKNKTIRTNQRVSVAISGGLASSVLLNFVHNGINEDNHKKLRVDPICLYIDDELSGEICMKNTDFVLEQCRQHNFPVYIAHISSVLADEVSTLVANTVPAVNLRLLEKFNSLINTISSTTSRLDLVTKLRRKLLLQCSEQLQCSFILTGEISTALASTMLSNLTLGRGAQMEYDVGFCDSRHQIRILKPIKDITYEEVKIYADMKHVQYIPENVLPPNSIQSTIQKFVTDLQENFPATISTICKTGEKMGGCGDIVQQNGDECVVCQSTLDTQDIKSSALQATNYSRLVSATGPQHTHVAPTSAPKCSSCNCTKKQITKEDVEHFLCYGCRLILRDVKDADVPDYYQDIVKQKIAMARLRNEINDFLI